MKPCLRRRTTSAGSTSANAAFSSAFSVPPASLVAGGIVRLSSISRWSQNGARSSSERAIVMRSAIVSRSSGR